MLVTRKSRNLFDRKTVSGNVAPTCPRLGSHSIVRVSLTLVFGNTNRESRTFRVGLAWISVHQFAKQTLEPDSVSKKIQVTILVALNGHSVSKSKG